MTVALWRWRQRDQQAFLRHLAEHGDPATAAASVGRCVLDAYRMRDACPAFAAAWARSLAIAWEQVETRVLSGLLAMPDGKTGDAAKAARLLDSRLALAVLQRRGAPATRVHGKPVDSAAVEALRKEIRELTR